MTFTATVKRSIAASVEQRVKAGKCLVCESDATKRGVCDRHYMAFRRMLQSKPTEEQADFEAAAIREGKILPVQEVRRITSDNPFAGL